jgi:hypothetical protein
MAKRRARQPKPLPIERDSVYFLKLILYFLVGTFWVHLSSDTWTAPLPVGLIFGAWYASHEHFQIDRKIELAVLVVSVFVSYFFPPRLLIHL